jgi:hypothetical protein
MVDGSGIDKFGEVLNFIQMRYEITGGRWIKDRVVWKSVEVRPNNIYDHRWSMDWGSMTLGEVFIWPKEISDHR